MRSAISGVVRFLRPAYAVAAAVWLAAVPAWAQNLVVNPELASSTSGWQFIGPGGLDPLQRSSRDWREPAAQGSLLLVNHGDTAGGALIAGALQCVPLPAGTSRVRFRVWLDLPADQNPATGQALPELRFKDAADCFSGALLDRVFATPRGLPENRPWINQEEYFDVPSGTLGVEVRLGSFKQTGSDTDPFVIYYDGVVLEPVAVERDLSTAIRLRGQITTVNDPSNLVDDSIAPGTPLTGEIVYDESLGGPADPDFSLAVPPSSAEFRFGAATLTASDSSAIRVTMQTGATDQVVFDAFTFDPSPAVNPLSFVVTLTDSSGSTLPDPSGVVDLVLADELASSRSFFISGIGFNIQGVLSHVEVVGVETDLGFFRASVTPSCPVPGGCPHSSRAAPDRARTVRGAWVRPAPR